MDYRVYPSIAQYMETLAVMTWLGVGCYVCVLVMYARFVFTDGIITHGMESTTRTSLKSDSECFFAALTL